MKKMKTLHCLLLPLLGLLMGCSIVNSSEYDSSIIPSSRRLLKVVNPQGLPSHLVEYFGMTVSFNKQDHIPNWVAWELTATEANGNIGRAKTFRPDTNVKGSAHPDDYKNSGYDRGHMAPAGDMKWSRKAMEESFYMTNVVPQNQTLNRASWNKLEQKCRARAEADSAVYIICGPVPNEPALAHIGITGVKVPQRFFKVVLSPYANPPRGIGFIFNNSEDNPGGMQKCAMTIDEVERITGYDFFSALPDSIENQLESQCNFNQWSRLK